MWTTEVQKVCADGGGAGAAVVGGMVVVVGGMVVVATVDGGGAGIVVVGGGAPSDVAATRALSPLHPAASTITAAPPTKARSAGATAARRCEVTEPGATTTLLPTPPAGRWYPARSCDSGTYAPRTHTYVDTPILHVGFESGGPDDGPPVLLLHGWPDDVRTFDPTLGALHGAGRRTYAPYLRGFGPTRFRDETTMRSGQISALTQDVLEFADALGLGSFAVVGHDWGARVAYLLGALAPDRVTRLAALSVGWSPGQLPTPAFEQARQYWYQWFMATERGAAVVREDGLEFARFQWQTWSPPSFYDEKEFDVTAASFVNPDWAAVTLHSYRVRWGEAEPDPAYTDIEARRRSARTISVPTLVIHGGDDRCSSAEMSEQQEQYFTGPYQRVMIDSVGHFPTREAPEEVNALLVAFLVG
jgi:pimeloyl-ACP methyl ester carboxylesterase